jgi:hypothetical protein
MTQKEIIRKIIADKVYKFGNDVITWKQLYGQHRRLYKQLSKLNEPNRINNKQQQRISN